VADAKAFRADVVIVDTIADVFAGSEIDRMQVNAFVKSCLGRLAQEIGGSVIALGHPSMAGKQSGEGESGSTAWSNAVRSRLYLKVPEGRRKRRRPRAREPQAQLRAERLQAQTSLEGRRLRGYRRVVGHRVRIFTKRFL
jgi:RecA-family ATPase